MNSVVAYNAFMKIAEAPDSEYLKVGDALARHGLTVDDDFEKIASTIDVLPEDQADDLWADAAISYAKKYASEIAEELKPFATRWGAGLAEKCASVGADPIKLLEKHSSAMEKQAGLGDVAMGAANIGSYFIPGVGTARMGYDAIKDFGGMFGKGLNWKQRLGKGMSGLMNTGFAALSVIPGLGAAGAGAKMLGKGGKFLSKAPKIGKLMGKVAPKLMGAGSKLQGAARGLAGGVASRLPSAGIGGKLGGMFFGKGGKNLLPAMTGNTMKAFTGAGTAMKGSLALGGMGMAGGLMQGMGPQQAAGQAGPAMGQQVMRGMPYMGTQGGGIGYRGTNFGGGVPALSRFSAGGRF